MEKLRIIGAAILTDKGNEFFSLDQVIEITGLDRLAIRRALERFIREGLVVRISQKPAYQLADASARRPHLGEFELGKGRPELAITYKVKSKEKLTQRVAPKLRENTAQDRIWSVLRNKDKADGSFSVAEVVTLAGVKKENVRWYLKRLRRVGIVRHSQAGGPGVRWALTKDAGPKRPALQRGGKP